MKSIYTKKIFALLIGIALALGASYASAYTPPPGPAPMTDVSGPVSVGVGYLGYPEVKAGSLGVNQFTAAQNAEFQGHTIVSGFLRGGEPTLNNSNISFGGYISSVEQKVSLVVSGFLHSKGVLQSTSLVNTTNKTLCADTNGKVVFCDNSTPPPPPPTPPSYDVANQNLAGLGYTSIGTDAWEGSVCLQSLATQNEDFTINFTAVISAKQGQYPNPGYVNVTSGFNGTIAAGTQCSPVMTQEVNPNNPSVYDYYVTSSCVQFSNSSISIDPAIEC